MSITEADVAVIGAGPVGLFAVFALGQVGLNAVVVDALSEAGGQCAALFPEKPIYDIPSRPDITGAALVEALLTQARPYAPDFRLGRRAVSISDMDGAFEIALSDGSWLRVKAVVIATGGGAFGPSRPPLAGLDAFEGQSVFYSVPVPARFTGKHVTIAGGGDSAADWAVHLAEIAASVTVVHRRPTFRAADATVAAMARLVEEGKIRVVAPGTLAGLEGEGTTLHAVRIDRPGSELLRVPADALLCFYGFAKDVSALSAWEVGAHREGIPVDPRTYATQRTGIFAIGDIAHYPGKLKLILTGFAEAAAAAHAARQHILPGRNFHFEHSTSKGVPSKP
ncbi:NAD(P)/FAD-dependent oxidoreductase [Tardiphaga sp.]|uniref:NAD(P)/FAD-dependent oxidoreductase n=1 Tax=Tardiphaga sp. TaxID=1926292 RepID=UPI002634BD5F|nr:NAD(P)/FAD-dependent oxidoreductase [Tardiphaga sp.]MDB5620386.1 NAD(P)/FAD-dependent oxidoreductase [Tardiphaga sp.]